MEKRNVTVSAIVAAIVLIGDQLSKHWAETWLRTNGEYKIGTGCCTCVTWKTGARPSA